MLNTLRTQLNQHLPAQQHFLLGLSGGVDSVVLLHLFSQLSHLNLRAVHIHHGLSPNADQWETFCRQQCQRYGIPFVSQKVHVKGKNGLEANARQARYQAIGDLIQPNEVFVTAHHLDDQAETFFLALKRGSGIKGLGAMQAVGNWQNFTLFRPFLTLPKTALIAHAKQYGLEWINDESNDNDGYDRNFLRNQILPVLNQRWQHFSERVARSAQHCAEQQMLIEELLTDELNQRWNDNRLIVQGFDTMSPLKQRQLLRLWLEKCGISMPSQTQLTAIIEAVIFARPDKTPQFELGEKILRRYQQAVYLTEKSAKPLDFQYLSLPSEQGKQMAFPEQIGTFVRTKNALVCEISGKIDRLLLPSELQAQPLIIKLHHSGKVRLYGKPQREEMKKIWQQHGVPVWERGRTPLIFYGNELVAVFNPKNS